MENKGSRFPRPLQHLLSVVSAVLIKGNLKVVLIWISQCVNFLAIFTSAEDFLFRSLARFFNCSPLFNLFAF